MVDQSWPCYCSLLLQNSCTAAASALLIHLLIVGAKVCVWFEFCVNILAFSPECIYILYIYISCQRWTAVYILLYLFFSIVSLFKLNETVTDHFFCCSIKFMSKVTDQILQYLSIQLVHLKWPIVTCAISTISKFCGQTMGLFCLKVIWYNVRVEKCRL